MSKLSKVVDYLLLQIKMIKGKHHDLSISYDTVFETSINTSI